MKIPYEQWLNENEDLILQELNQDDPKGSSLNLDSVYNLKYKKYLDDLSKVTLYEYRYYLDNEKFMSTDKEVAEANGIESTWLAWEVPIKDFEYKGMVPKGNVFSWEQKQFELIKEIK